MIYAPSEDSFLLAECVRHYRGKRALEIGVGSGIILEALQNRFESVAGTDIDHEALRSCIGEGSALLVCCDSAAAFAAEKMFDLIISNPPYLPDDEGFVDQTVHGGPSGIEATVKFINSALPLLAESGRILVVISSLADSTALENLVASASLKRKVIRQKKLSYEILSVVELTR